MNINQLSHIVVEVLSLTKFKTRTKIVDFDDYKIYNGYLDIVVELPINHINLNKIKVKKINNVYVGVKRAKTEDNGCIVIRVYDTNNINNDDVSIIIREFISRIK